MITYLDAREIRLEVSRLIDELEASAADEFDCPVCRERILGTLVTGEGQTGRYYHPPCFTLLVLTARDIVTTRRKTPPPVVPMPYYPHQSHPPLGCVCPPGSEQTCRNAMCGRRPFPSVITTGGTVDG